MAFITDVPFSFQLLMLLNVIAPALPFPLLKDMVWRWFWIAMFAEWLRCCVVFLLGCSQVCSPSSWLPSSPATAAIASPCPNCWRWLWGALITKITIATIPGFAFRNPPSGIYNFLNWIRSEYVLAHMVKWLRQTLPLWCGLFGPVVTHVSGTG